MSFSVEFQVDDLDIVVGGHTNTFLWNGAKPRYIKHEIMGQYPTVITHPNSGNRALVVQTNGYGRYLGQLKVNFDDSGRVESWEGNPILLNSTYPMDETLQVIAHFLAQ